MKLRNAFGSFIFWLGFVGAVVYGTLLFFFTIGDLGEDIFTRVLGVGFSGFFLYAGISLAWTEWKREEGLIE